MAFIITFIVGKLILATGDLSYLVLLAVYGVDSILTIVHRLMLHENIFHAHRKHMYQLMANELGMSHVLVSTIYALVQLGISLVFVWLGVIGVGGSFGGTLAFRYGYLCGVVLVLCVVYVIFMKKNYWRHEETLRKIAEGER
jgi:magnesium-transporting ATPase (P-type)